MTDTLNESSMSSSTSSLRAVASAGAAAASSSNHTASPSLPSDQPLRIAFVGDCGVGKSILCRQLVAYMAQLAMRTSSTSSSASTSSPSFSVPIHNDTNGNRLELSTSAPTNAVEVHGVMWQCNNGSTSQQPRLSVPAPRPRAIELLDLSGSRSMSELCRRPAYDIADAVVFVYDVHRAATLSSLALWHAEVFGREPATASTNHNGGAGGVAEGEGGGSPGKPTAATSPRVLWMSTGETSKVASAKVPKWFLLVGLNHSSSSSTAPNWPHLGRWFSSLTGSSKNSSAHPGGDGWGGHAYTPGAATFPASPLSFDGQQSRPVWLRLVASVNRVLLFLDHVLQMCLCSLLFGWNQRTVRFSMHGDQSRKRMIAALEQETRCVAVVEGSLIELQQPFSETVLGEVCRFIEGCLQP